MSWRRGMGGGGLGDAVGRAFGDNPLTWSLPLYSAWGIRVRVHILFIIFIVAQLAYSLLTSDAFGPPFMAITMLGLFVIVLLHEYGHCIACRMVKGEASEIMLWPLGGLAMCAPPDTWKANLITVGGGPMVNVILAPILGLAVLLASGTWDAVIFNPFNPGSTAASLSASNSLALFGLFALWTLYYMNLILLGFNVLVPMYPMDGGRIVQAILWRRLGETRALQISLRIGIVAAIAMVMFGMVTRETILMGIGLFGGIVCWFEHRRLSAPDDLGGPQIDLSAAFDHPDKPDPGPSKREIKEQECRRRFQEQIDQILDKIAREGMGSLSRGEKKLLKQETERKRGVEH